MSSCSSKVSSALSNLASVIFILLIVVFIYISLVWVFFILYMFLNTWYTVIIVSLTSLLANYNICVGSGSILILLLFSSSGLFYMSDNFCLHARHYEFYLVGCWIFWYFCKSSELCCRSQRLGNSLILLVLLLKVVRWDQSSV